MKPLGERSPRPESRRAFLARLAWLGAGVMVALPARFWRRVTSPRLGAGEAPVDRAGLRLRVRKLERSDLYRPHDLAG